MESFGPAADQGLEVPKRCVDFLVEIEENHLVTATTTVRNKTEKETQKKASVEEVPLFEEDDVRIVKPAQIDKLEMDQWKEDKTCTV